MLARSFFVRIIIKVAGNQGKHKSLVRFDFGPNQTTHFGVTCFEWRKFHTFEFEYLWNQLANLDQMCSIIGVGERLLKVLGQIDLGTLDSGERSLPFGLLVPNSYGTILVVLQHQLEIVIDHRLKSVGAYESVLSIIIGCWIFMFSMHVHVCLPAFCVVLLSLVM